MSSVYANGRSITHKGDGQVSTAAPPDVCKTPSPGGPVPIPYVNVAKNSDLADGTTTVSIESNPAANDASNLSTSTGDEPGTAGGGLLSSKTKGKLTWATKSPTVKLEGKGAVRFMDVTQHNGNSFNTYFTEMGGTGMAYGDDFDGPCPLCKKAQEKHRILELKESASIASDILKQLHRNPLRHAKTSLKKDGTLLLKGYMVGVLVCRCKKWATTSGSTPTHFAEAAKGCTVIGGGGVNAAQLAGSSTDAYYKILDSFEVVDKLRASTDKATAELRTMASKPGECAAQKLLARAQGHELLSMTEVFWQPKEGGWKQKYFVRMTSRAGTNLTKMSFRDLSAADAESGNTKRAVASCHTCQLTLPFVLCDLGNWKC